MLHHQEEQKAVYGVLHHQEEQKAVYGALHHQEKPETIYGALHHQEKPETVYGALHHQEKPETIYGALHHQEKPEIVYSALHHQEKPETVYGAPCTTRRIRRLSTVPYTHQEEPETVYSVLHPPGGAGDRLQCPAPTRRSRRLSENQPLDKRSRNNYHIIMDTLKFEWDENKNQINQRKHGISFNEAKTVFYDTEALVIDDPEHSQEEERFIILGLSNKANLLVVCHCYRASETVIRIISARKATKTESKYYRK